MTLTRRAVVASGVAATVAACSPAPIKGRYDGPEVTRVQVYKGSRRLFLFNDREVLRAYRVHLGFRPDGHKQHRGDGRTPEGSYLINRRNPKSNFHLSLGISYPDREDILRAIRRGQHPGGDIFVHGDRRPGIDPDGPDWTAGCIAVRNREMEDIYKMVAVGCPIDIFA